MCDVSAPPIKPDRFDRREFDLYLHDSGLWRQPDSVKDVLQSAFMAGLRIGELRGKVDRG